MNMFKFHDKLLENDIYVPSPFILLDLDLHDDENVEEFVSELSNIYEGFVCDLIFNKGAVK